MERQYAESKNRREREFSSRAAAFMSSNGVESDADKNVERWEAKKPIKSLEAARGCVKKALETRSRPQANKGVLAFLRLGMERA